MINQEDKRLSNNYGKVFHRKVNSTMSCSFVVLFFYQECTSFVSFCSTDYLKVSIVLYSQKTYIEPCHGGRLLKIFHQVVFIPKRRI